MDFPLNNSDWSDKYDFELSNLITEARIYSRLTQEKLAERIGTTQSSIARAESGAVLPSHGLLKRIAEAIGTTLMAPYFGFMKPEGTSIEINSETSAPDWIKFRESTESITLSGKDGIYAQ